MSGEPRYAFVDDRDSQVQYSGDWFRTGDNTVAEFDQLGFSGPTFNTSLSQSSTNGSSISFSFHGTGVGFFGTSSTDGPHIPRVECVVDGREMPDDSYGTNGLEANNHRLCYGGGIPDGLHTAVLTIKDVDSNDLPLFFDYIGYRPSPNLELNDTTESIFYDDSKSRVKLSSGWTAYDLSWTLYSSQAESTVELNFEGQSVSMYGFIINGTGRASVSSYSLDGQQSVAFDVPESKSLISTYYTHPYFTISDLEPGQHSLVVTDNTDHILDSPLTFTNFDVRGFSTQLEAEPPGTSSGNSSSSQDSGLSVGAIVGIAVGGVVALAVIAALVAFFILHKRRKSPHLSSPDPVAEVQWQKPSHPSSPSNPATDAKLRPVSFTSQSPDVTQESSQNIPHFNTVASPPSGTLSPTRLYNPDYQYMAHNAYHAPVSSSLPQPQVVPSAYQQNAYSPSAPPMIQE